MFVSIKIPLEDPFDSQQEPQPPHWDNYESSPMLELWTARTRSREEPQMQH